MQPPRGVDAALAEAAAENVDIDAIVVEAAPGTRFALTQHTPEGTIVHFCGQVHVDISGNGNATIRDQVTATVTKEGWLFAHGETQVTASDTTWVYATETAQVTASGTAEVRAHNQVQVTASGDARVVANDSATVTATGNARVVALPSAHVTGQGSAVRIWAAESAHVDAEQGTIRKSSDDVIEQDRARDALWAEFDFIWEPPATPNPLEEAFYEPESENQETEVPFMEVSQDDDLSRPG